AYSTLACLLCADPSLPRPSISLSFTSVTAPGADATIRCQGQRRDVRFFLHKAGDLNLQRQMDPAGDGAEFLIPTVGRQHGGSYSCSYRPRSEPFVSSQQSDPLQLVVAEPSYPKPSISLHPSGRVALGGTVTVQCRGRHQNMRFLLYKDGNPNVLQDVEPAGDLAEFPIRNVSWRDAGSYSCYYHDKWYLFIWSRPSDSVELVVAGDVPGITNHRHPGSSFLTPVPPTDSGSIPAGGADPTQPGTTPAPTGPSSTGPGTRAGGTKSLSTPPETGLCCPRSRPQGESRRAGWEGGRSPQQMSHLNPSHQPHFIC
uniref:Ig-like domain-containing protein n=1 Tax=Chrysemys picta bellii TaxID=8478 RepID=A0A8C3HNI2_CHRPI